jgi:hypothetical protein
MRLWVAGAAAIAVALFTSPVQAAKQIGGVENQLRNLDPALSATVASTARSVGYGMMRIDVTWGHGVGTSAFNPSDLEQVRNAVTAAQANGMEVLVNFYPDPHIACGKRLPLGAAQIRQFGNWVKNYLEDPALRNVKYVAIGNEPNLSRFWCDPATGRRVQQSAAYDQVLSHCGSRVLADWCTRYGPKRVHHLTRTSEKNDYAAPAAYERLLAYTYDRIQELKTSTGRNILVVGGNLASRSKTYGPAEFIAKMNDYYRSSGRTAPLMDVFGFHPYGIAGQSPLVPHPDSDVIGMADYPHLVSALSVFDGSAQMGSNLPILYDEYGVQTIVPVSLQAQSSRGYQPNPGLLVDPQVQYDYYRQAVSLVNCQKTVIGILFFLLYDDPKNFWTGLYYSGGGAKPSASFLTDPQPRIAAPWACR